MIDLGLTSAGQKALIKTLATSGHKVDVQVGVLDMEHRWVESLNGKITGGQVNIDADADITRQLQLTFVDRGGRAGVDTPDGRPDVSRMVRVRYRVFVEDVINGWVSIPIFTGPITKVSRVGAEVTLEAMGKEHLLLGPAWRSKVYAKGSPRVWVVRSILRDLTGERRIRFPKGWTYRTSKPITMKKDSAPWPQVQSLARGMRAQLFYDGRGFARMRRRPVRTLFTFKDGNGGMLLSIPAVSESADSVINLVRVVGAVPTGKKNPLVFTDKLPSAHPHSAVSLGRHGEPRYLPEQIDDDSLRTQKEVEAAARRRLQEIKLDEQMVTFDCLPMPLLEEGDLFTIDAKDVKVTGRVSRMTVPLGHEGVSTIGYIAPVRKRRR